MSEEEFRVVSVAELGATLKRMSETTTRGLWVEGEAGKIQRPASGHVYFSLKDENADALIDCVMYRREALRFGKLLSEGARLQIRGYATFYPPRGRMQWVADAVREQGRGQLLVELEKLKQKLAGEGLFALERKRNLPKNVRAIGVVTSRTGAAFLDICTVARRRGRVRIVLSPALVQGDDAPMSIIAALDRLEKVEGLDVLIVGRGGGSQEDLLAFNDERVVRRLARATLPVVSAVGHEIDYSLADLVADARAATPSQAAEMLVPDERAHYEELRLLRGSLARACLSVVSRARLTLGQARRRLGEPRVILAGAQQDLDEVSRELSDLVLEGLRVRRREETRFARRLTNQHPRAVLLSAKAELLPMRERLMSASAARMNARRAELSMRAGQLQALSPLSILGRGYALAFDETKRPLFGTEGLALGARVSVRLAKGAFRARVEATSEDYESLFVDGSDAERE